MAIKSIVIIKIIFLTFLIVTYQSICSFFIREIPVKSFQQNEISILKEIIYFEHNFNLNLSTNEYEEFRAINSQNKLIDDNIIFLKPKNPEITVIMTIYNQANCFYICLRSIQNQTIKNIEIIIVDDCSSDNSTEIIKQYQKEDPRIILLKHYSNKGKIKARSDGIRKAKGKYITIIDGDDSFIHKDILNNSLYIAKKAHLDVVEFQMGRYKNSSFIGRTKNYPKLNLTYIVKQPELRTKFIFENESYPNDFINRAICGKLIKKELFDQMLKDVGVEYFNDYINIAEDTIMAISLLHLANSYYLMKELGYYYSLDKKKSTFPKLKKKICKHTNLIKDFSFFKYMKFLIGKIKNNEKEQLMAYKEITTTVNYNYYFNRFNMKNQHLEILFFIFNKTLEFDFLQQEQKAHILELKDKAIKKINIESIRL